MYIDILLLFWRKEKATTTKKKNLSLVDNLFHLYFFLSLSLSRSVKIGLYNVCFFSAIDARRDEFRDNGSRENGVNHFDQLVFRFERELNMPYRILGKQLIRSSSSTIFLFCCC